MITKDDFVEKGKGGVVFNNELTNTVMVFCVGMEKWSYEIEWNKCVMVAMNTSFHALNGQIVSWLEWANGVMFGWISGINGVMDKWRIRERGELNKLLNGHTVSEYNEKWF